MKTSTLSRLAGHSAGAATLLALLSACGGSSAPVIPPVVLVAPSILIQPSDMSVSAGAAARFDVSAGGSEPLTYQWQRNGANIAGATAIDYTLPAALLSDSGSKWRVTVSNAAGAAVSTEATLSVTSAVNPGAPAFAGSVVEAGRADGAGPAARFDYPRGLAFDKAGNLLVADFRNSSVRKISPAGVVSTSIAALAANPIGVAFDAADNLYVVNGMAVSKFTPSGQSSTLATVPHCSGRGASMCVPYHLTVDSAANVWVSSTYALRKIAPDGSFVVLEGSDGATFSNTGSFSQRALASDRKGGVYFVDQDLRHFDAAGAVRTIAGGFGSQAAGAAVDAAGNLYVSDAGNHVVRKVTPAGVVSTVAGVHGMAGVLPGLLTSPGGLAIDANGNLFVTSGHAIVKLPLPAQ